MDENNNNIVDIKAELKKKGAKITGTKNILTKRLKIWNKFRLARKLYTIPAIQDDSEPFPHILSWKPLTTINKKIIKLELDMIDEWFYKNLAGSSLKRGRAMGLNGFIISLECNIDSNNETFFKSKCKAEMKKNCIYSIKIHLKHSKICKANCSCVAGSGFSAACKHVGACLYVIEHFSKTGISLEYVTPTSVLQKWHRPKNNNSTCAVESFQEFMGYCKEPDILPCQTSTDHLINLFINKRIASDLTAVRKVNVEGYLNDHCYTKYLAYDTMVAVNEMSIGEKINVEKRTLSQSNCKLWKTIRITRITASFVGEIVKRMKSEKSAQSICKKIFSPVNLKVPAVVHGRVTESVAFNAYCGIVKHLKIRKCGIFIDSEIHFLAASPDGIDVNNEFVIEIKCPYKAINCDNLSYIKNNKLLTTHNYYYQMQIQMHVTKTKMCHFLVYSTNIGFLHIETICYNKIFVEDCINHIKIFYKNVFCPEYLKTF